MNPMPSRWTAGSDHGLVWPGGLAVVDGGCEQSAVDALWEAVTQRSDLRHFVETLAQCCHGGLLGLPDFAAVFFGTESEGAQVAARGRFAVTGVDVDGAPLAVDGASVTTWVERRIAASAHICLGSTNSGGPARPLSSGVVPAAALEWGAPPTPEPLVVELDPVVQPEPIEESADNSATTPAHAPSPSDEPAHDPGSDADHIPAVVVEELELRAPDAPEPVEDPDIPEAPEHDDARTVDYAVPLLSADPQAIPPVGVVHTSDGQTCALGAPLYVGRNPQAHGDAQLLELVHPHVSSTHLRLWAEGEEILAEDLGSTNGTCLRRGDAPPAQLESPIVVVPGDVLDLGRGVHLWLETI